MKNKLVNVILRPKRQITLPNDVCNQLGIATGDILEVAVEDTKLIARPRKMIALKALKEIQDAFQLSGISEEEIQIAGKQAREKIAGKRYGIK